MYKKSEMLLPIMMALSGMDIVESEPKEKPPQKERDCRVCGKPVHRDSLTCSKECFLEHRRRVKNAV